MKQHRAGWIVLHVYERVHGCVCKCPYGNVSKHMHGYMHRPAWDQSACVCIHPCTNMCIGMCMDMCISECENIHVDMRISMPIDMCLDV